MLSDGTVAHPGDLEVMELRPGSEAGAVAVALRGLLEHHEAENIAILSPFGESRSSIGQLFARAEKGKDEWWLRKQLQKDGTTGKVRWRSIFKFKGLKRMPSSPT